MVEIIKPVFLINWLYLSVYWNESNRIKTSAKINIVKNSLKKRLFKFSLNVCSINTPLNQLKKLIIHIANRVGKSTMLTNFFDAMKRSSLSDTGLMGSFSLVILNK